MVAKFDVLVDEDHWKRFYFMLSLSYNNKADVVEAFNPTSIYLDDLPTGVTFAQVFSFIYC